MTPHIESPAPVLFLFDKEADLIINDELARMATHIKSFGPVFFEIYIEAGVSCQPTIAVAKQSALCSAQDGPYQPPHRTPLYRVTVPASDYNTWVMQGSSGRL